MTMETRFLPFGGLPSDASTERSEYQIIEPVAGVAGQTVEFQISASQAGMLDLSQTYLLSRVTVAQGAAAGGAGTNIKPFEEDEAPEEGFADAMWSSCELYINGVNVSDSAPGLYPYASWFRNALTKSQEWASGGLSRYAAAKAGSGAGTIGEGAAITAFPELQCQLLAQPAGWGAENQGYCLADKAVGSGALLASNGGTNLGSVVSTPYQSPALAFRQSKVVSANRLGALHQSEYITTPNIGIMRQTGYLPADIDIRLVFTKSAPAFYMHGTIGNTPAITWGVAGTCSARLFLKRVYPTAIMQEHITKMALERPFRYNTTQSRVQKTTLGQATSVDVTNLLTGVRPDVVIVAFIPSKAADGAVSRNPFGSSDVIQHSGEQNTATAADAGVQYGYQGDYVSSIFVNWGGKQYPMRPMLASSIDDNGEAYAAYMAACKGGHFGERTPMISPAGFRAGRKFFTFQLNADQTTAGSHAMDLSDRGSLEVHATIVRNALFTEDTTMITCGFHSASVEIDSTRSIRKEGF